MTGLNRVVRRETAVVCRGRLLIVELHPGYLTLRQKGRRQSVVVDYRAAFDLGHKILFRSQQADKKGKK
jgi:hypothetical protein